MRTPAEKAARAHTDINIFAAVVTLLEGGHLYNSTGTVNVSASRIIKIAKAAARDCLRVYDKHIEEAKK